MHLEDRCPARRRREHRENERQARPFAGLESQPAGVNVPLGSWDTGRSSIIFETHSHGTRSWRSTWQRNEIVAIDMAIGE